MQAFRYPMLTILLALAACAPAAQTSFTEAQRALAEAEVREAVAQLTAAFNAQDPDQVFSHYRDSPEFVLLGCTDLMFGWEFFTRVLRPYLESPRQESLEREVLRIQVLNPETAVVTLQGGSADGPHLFWTQLLVREGVGHWLVAHEHQSWSDCREPARVHTFGDFGDLGDFDGPDDPGEVTEP